MNCMKWKYFYTIGPHLSQRVRDRGLIGSTKLLLEILNCCKLFGSTKCLQQVFEGQRFTVSFLQDQEDVKIICILV